MSSQSTRRLKRTAASGQRFAAAALLVVFIALLLLGGIGYFVPPLPPAAEEKCDSESEIEMAGNGKGEWRLLRAKPRSASMDEKICAHIHGGRNYFLAAGLLAGAFFLLLRRQARPQHSDGGGRKN